MKSQNIQTLNDCQDKRDSSTGATFCMSDKAKTGAYLLELYCGGQQEKGKLGIEADYT